MQAIEPPVRLTEVFPLQAVLIGLRERAKQGVVEELVHHAIVLGRFSVEVEGALVQLILTREKRGTTALGNGIALPHTPTPLTNTLQGVVGVDEEGVPFDALDGEPVHVVFLLFAPLHDRVRHFELLGRINAMSRDKAFRLQIRGCRTPQDVHDLLLEWDRSAAPSLPEQQRVEARSFRA